MPGHITVYGWGDVLKKCREGGDIGITVDSTGRELHDNLNEDVSTKISKIQEELREKCKELYEKYSVQNMYEVKRDHEDEYNRIVSWYKKEMKPFEDKRKQICQNLKRICYDNTGLPTLDYYIFHGGMKDREINIYKEWDDKKLSTLVNFGVIIPHQTKIRDILTYYNGINSFDINKGISISQAGLKLSLSLLDSFNKVDDDSINLIKKCIQDGVVTFNSEKLLSYSKKELENMIKCHDKLGITFNEDLDSLGERLKENFDFYSLEQIKKLFGIKFSYHNLFSIAGKKFNIDILEDLSKFLKNKQLETNVLIETLIKISELGMENYRKFVDNFEMLKNVGIEANFYSGTTFGQGVNFLGDDLKIWTYTPEEGREDAKLQNIVVWPLLEACHKAGLVLPYKVHDIINGNVSKIFFALLKKDYYESPETAPQNIKQFLDIDRAGVEYLQNKGIKLELQFFVQKDKTTKTFQLKNQSIHIENFEKIDNIYPLKFVTYYKMMEHIQEGHLEEKDILWILVSRLKNENFTNFDRYRNPDIGKFRCSLDQALEIMDKYVAEHSQGQ